jgi:hypothetical protein
MADLTGTFVNASGVTELDGHLHVPAGISADQVNGVSVNNTPTQDATWLGALDTRFGAQQFDVTGGAGLVEIVSQTLALPSGVAFGPQVSVSAQATAGAYTLSNAYLIATRLG